jgi:hypothetical protein
MYMSGGAFDFLALGQAFGVDYLAATARASGGGLFDLVPLTFSGGVTLTGFIRTDGTRGALSAANILDWGIDVVMVTEDVFNASNSVLLASGVSLSADGSALQVGNPDGSLAFRKGSAGGHPFELQLADFTDQSPPGGQAGYFQGRLAVTTLPLNAQGGQWRVTGTDPVTQSVPEPTALMLQAGALLAMLGAALARGRRLHTRTPRAMSGSVVQSQ